MQLQQLQKHENTRYHKRHCLTNSFSEITREALYNSIQRLNETVRVRVSSSNQYSTYFWR